MTQDAYGLDLTTSSDDAAATWNRAVAASLEHRLAAADHVKAALDADPEFVMALTFRGAMMLMIGSNQVHGKVAEIAARARELAPKVTRREQMHVAGLEHWLAGHNSKACGVWQEIIDAWPADILALRFHHHGSFWSGDRKGLLGAPMGVFRAIGEKAHGANFVQGMAAFGYEENGDYERAETFGRRAMEANGNDLWSLHAVAHVFEMQCRHDEGRALLNQPYGAWSDRSPFKDHLWWHAALFSLEMGDTEHVLELYDREVRVDETGFYLDVQNAASLLKRLELVGVDVGERWEELANLAESRTGDHVMPFTDAHFMLALTGAGRLEAARGYLSSLRAFARTGGNDAADVTANVTAPLCEGLLACAERRHDEAADILYGLRHEFTPMGASHAQRDIFQQVMIDAVMRAGRGDTARALLKERQALRPGSDWAQERLKTLG